MSCCYLQNVWITFIQVLLRGCFTWGLTTVCAAVLSGCSVQVERRGLEAHLSECNYRRECPNGCGHTLPSPDQSQHNCVAALRTEVEMLRYACSFTSKTQSCHLNSIHILHPNRASINPCGRAEMLCKVEEVRREMESRLDSQRRHMVLKESQLKNEVEELKVTYQTFSSSCYGTLY